MTQTSPRLAGVGRWALMAQLRADETGGQCTKTAEVSELRAQLKRIGAGEEFPGTYVWLGWRKGNLPTNNRRDKIHSFSVNGPQ